MNGYTSKTIKGFTLLELLLVSVIIAMILYASMAYIQERALQARVDRTSGQMQQILNAAMSYYIQNGQWPTSMACLQGTGASPCVNTISYVPTNMVSPWGGTQYTAIPATQANVAGQVFYVWIPVTSVSSTGSAYAIAQEIAGALPTGYVSQDSGSATTPPNISSTCSASQKTCYVVASVNIPGQNLNNATAVNFSGLYHNGGCVPVPQCPVDTITNQVMIPQVFVVPVSVSGLNDPTQTTTTTGNNVYPISSFSGYATGGTTSSPPLCNTGSTGSNAPPGMSQVTATQCAGIQGDTGSPTGFYWRACLEIYTEKGLVSSSTSQNSGTVSNAWGGLVSVMAITRCAVANEPAGSNFTVYQ